MTRICSRAGAIRNLLSSPLKRKHGQTPTLTLMTKTKYEHDLATTLLNLGWISPRQLHRFRKGMPVYISTGTAQAGNYTVETLQNYYDEGRLEELGR